MGIERFLFERVFEDCLERLAMFARRFESAMLLGCPDSSWPGRLEAFCASIEVRDPGATFARDSGGEQIVEDAWTPAARSYDLVVAIGTLDTVDALPLAFRLLFEAMRDGGLMIGAMSGGDTLPRLRAAMRAADAVTGEASPRIHPRVEAAALAPLLEQVGFTAPVVDVDRAQVAYSSFDRLVDDLRRMGATNVLGARSRRGLSRSERDAASSHFASAGDGRRTVETFEILHFTATKPGDGRNR